MQNTRQLKAGIILNYLVIALNVIVGLSYTPYLLYKLGQNQYGLYSLVASIIAYLSILDLGLGSAVVRFTARLKAQNKTKEQSELYGMFIVLYSILGVIALLIGIILYDNVENLFSQTMTSQDIRDAQVMILMLVINVAVSFPLSVFSSVVQAHERFIFLKSIDILRILLTTATMIILLHYGFKAIALVLVQTLVNMLVLISHWYYARKEIKMRFVFGKPNFILLKEIAYYSFWIFLMIIVDRIYMNTGQFVLGATVGTVAVAIYAIGVQLNTMYQQLSTAMSSIFLPRISQMVAIEDNYKEVSDLFIMTGRLQFIIMSLVLSGFIVFGRQFIILWAGNDYEEAYWIALLFFIPSIIPLIQNLGIVILQARNQMKFRSVCYSVISAVCLVLQILLAKKLGTIGCAMAVSIAIIAGQIIAMNLYYYFVQKIDIPIFLLEILKMSVLPVAFSIIGILISTNSHCFADSFIYLGIAIIIYLLLYICLAYFIQFNNYERQLAKSIITKIINHDRNHKKINC